MILSSRRSPSTTAMRPPVRSTSDAQSVAPARSPANARRSTGARNACGVCAATSSERSTVSATTPSRTRFRVSATGKNGHDAVVALAEWREQPLDDGVVHERSRRVVDEHDERLLGNLRERGRHRFRPRGASGDAGDDLRRRELLGEQDRGLLPPRRGGHDDRVDQLAAVQSVEALGEQRAPAEARERLRTIDTEPLAGAGSGDQAPRWPRRRRSRPIPTRSPLRPSASLAPSASAARPSTGRRRARGLPLPRSCPSRT